MKKIILSAFMFWASNVMAQVTLEHTYPTSDDEYISVVYKYNLYEQAVGFVWSSSDTDVYEFYSSDHVFINSITLSGIGNSFITQISTHLFNNDDKIEFLFRDAVNIDGTIINNYKLYNQDGEELYDFGNVDYQGVIRKGNDFLLRFKDKETKNALFYKLEGTPPEIGVNENGDVQAERNAYPNPAKQFINLQYELPKGETASMMIYNQNGQRIDELKIGSYFKECQLDVSAYTPGVYFYSYNGITKKFIVQ